VYLFKIFKLNPRKITLEKENRLLSDDSTLGTLDTAIKPFTVNEVKAVIKYLDPKKAPNYNLITNQVLQNLPEKGIKYISNYVMQYLVEISFHSNER